VRDFVVADFQAGIFFDSVAAAEIYPDLVGTPPSSLNRKQT